MAMLILRTQNRRGLLHEVTGVIKDFANIEWVFVAVPSENERIIAMRLSDSLPLSALSRLNSTSGVIEVWAGHEAPMELVGFDREILVRAMRSLMDNNHSVSDVFNRLGYETGRYVASTMARTKYGLSVYVTDNKRLINMVLSMLVILNMARSVELMGIDEDKGILSINLVDPFDYDMGLSFTQGYLMGMVKSLFRCECEIQIERSRSRINAVITVKR
jgi:hypothetical protein